MLLIVLFAHREQYDRYVLSHFALSRIGSSTTVENMTRRTGVTALKGSLYPVGIMQHSVGSAMTV